MELQVEDRGAVEVWTIDGAPRRNTLTRALVAALGAELRRAAASRALRCVVLTGAGDRAFCAGADLKERAGMSDDEVRAFLSDLGATLRGFETAPQIFVAALNGVAVGGGLELALACDLRVMSTAAEVGLPEVSLGIIPGAGGTQRLPRAVGMARAKELVLTARRLVAHEALAWGLVSRLVPPELLRHEAIALAETVAANAPVSLRQAKRAMNEGAHLPIQEALELERRMYQDCLGTKDRREALQAFAEKRRPIFTGE
jgi:enoyl-CoA hydratase/carnithine racemase